MNVIAKVREGMIVAPVPVQLMFGGCPVDPEFLDVAGPVTPAMDEVLDARCASL